MELRSLLLLVDWRMGSATRLHFFTTLDETVLDCDSDTSYPSVDMEPLVPVAVCVGQ